MTNKNDIFAEPENFSLALGGPLFQFCLRTRLSGPALELLYRRIIVITAIAWLPLTLLTALQGHLVSVFKCRFFRPRRSGSLTGGIAASDRSGAVRSPMEPRHRPTVHRS
jgi:hypothetical protein